jgi:tripartite-type tricarboxylate transporter receptor subunit TctC
VEALPDVPTVAETLPGYEAGAWFGLGAPRDTPTQVVSRLNEAVNRGLGDEGVRRDLAALGGSTMPGSAAEFGRFIASETARYGGIIRRAGIRRG